MPLVQGKIVNENLLEFYGFSLNQSKGSDPQRTITKQKRRIEKASVQACLDFFFLSGNYCEIATERPKQLIWLEWFPKSADRTPEKTTGIWISTFEL